eukprot:6296587-Alexandrium_andersonii.AAC.1
MRLLASPVTEPPQRRTWLTATAELAKQGARPHEDISQVGMPQHRNADQQFAYGTQDEQCLRTKMPE